MKFIRSSNKSFNRKQTMTYVDIDTNGKQIRVSSEELYEYFQIVAIFKSSQEQKRCPPNFLVQYITN